MSLGLLAQATVQLTSAALYAWLLAALGRRLLRRLERRRGPAERLALDLALGFAAFGQTLFVFGLLGWIKRGSALALLAIVAAACARDGLGVARDLLALVLPPAGARARRRWWSVAVPFGLVLAPMLVLALYPPTAFDALNYHLPYVDSFAETGRLVTNWTLRYPVFPQIVELVITVPYLLVGVSAAESFLLAPTLAVALLVGAWAARAGGRSSGPVAAALWLGSPLVVWLAARAYVDHSLCLFVAGGLYAVDAWRTGRGRGWLLLGGVLLGAACGTKYLGLPWAALGTGLAFLSARSAVGLPAGRASGGRVRAALVVALVAFAFALPWYARVAWETRNPVFPYLSEIFAPGTEWMTPDPGLDVGTPNAIDDRPGQGPLRSPFRGGVTGVLALPVSATWARDSFDRQAPATPWALPVFLAIVWGARRDRRLLFLLLASVAFCFTLLLQARIGLRFVLTPAAVLSAAGAVALRPFVARAYAVARRVARRFAVAGVLEALTLLALIGCGPLYGVYKIRERGIPPSDEAGRHAHLSRWVPAYDGIEYLNRELGSDYTAYGLHVERIRYYARGRFLGDWYGPYRFRLVEPLLDDPRRLYERLLTWEVGHLITRRDFGEGWGERAAPCFVRVWEGEQSHVFRLAGLDERGACVGDGGRAGR